MELLKHLKVNSSTFHLRAKEEVDELFREMAEQKLPIDDKLDFMIRMSIQKVKLQLYYELKLVEYRRTVSSAKKNVEPKASVIRVKDRNKARMKKKETSIEKDNKRMEGLTKEEIIEANKKRVSKFHPAPDLSHISSSFYKARKKIEYEKEMLEKTKGQWVSIISIPMG